MPGSYRAATPYSTSGHAIYLSGNPSREVAVRMPALGEPRSHGFTDAQSPSRKGYRQAIGKTCSQEPPSTPAP